MRNIRIVALIVDPNFGSSVAAIAATAFHTWIVDSDENCAAVEPIWKSSSKPFENKVENGITIFRRYGADRESWADAAFELIEDHHDSSRGNLGYAALDVHGTPLTSQLRHTLVDLGFASFSEFDFGFRAAKGHEINTD
jgi:hypothetical protein